MPGHKNFWTFQAKGASEGALFLYGEISTESWYGDEVTPKRFKEELEALGAVDTLHVYVNSGGGDVFAGWNIINLLKRHSARKIGYNDGLAASIAFDILMGMDEVVAMKNSLFMTHNCQTWARGDRHRLAEICGQMEKIDQMRVEAAAARSGKTVDEMAALQDAETWYTAEEAEAAGFADRVEANVKLAACVSAYGRAIMYGQDQFIMSRYANREKLAAAMERLEAAGLDAPGAPCHATSARPTGGLSAMGIENSGAKPSGCGTRLMGRAEPYNGGGSQPVEDTDPAQAALEEQRHYLWALRRKVNGGKQDATDS